MNKLGWAGGALALSLLVAPAVFGTHEPDHRFTVYGTVYDDQGRPTPDVKVFVVDTRVDQGVTAFTGRNGKYEALLHLHDADLGNEIVVTALKERKTVRVEFNPKDKTTPRKVRLDFGAPGVGSSGVGLSGTVIVLMVALVAGALAGIAFARRRKPSAKKAGKKGR